MATAQKALDFLRANLGVGEHPDGSNANWLTDWFGVGHVAWCAITVSRALNEAWGNPDVWQVPGVRRDYVKGVAYVPNLRLYFIAAGLYDQNPRVGDVIIYGWSAGSDGDHTGLVEQVLDDGTIIALEGNQANDLVRIRRSRNVILGFGHPPYDNEEDPFMTLSAEEQKQLLDQTAATNAAVARLEVAVLDPIVGLFSRPAGAGGTIDVDRLAARLAEQLGKDEAGRVADELAARLKS